MEVHLCKVVFASLCVFYAISNEFVKALPLDNNCLYGLLKTELKPCHTYGRQRLEPCTIKEEKDLITVLKSDAFRVQEVGGEYVPRSMSMDQVALESIVIPTDTSLYFIQPTLAVSPPGVCENGAASPHTADMCRVLYTEGLTFDAAKAKCEAERGMMLCVNNKWDQDHLPAISSEVWLGFEYDSQKLIWHGTWRYWDGGDYSNAAAAADLPLGHDSVYMRRDGAWAFTNQSQDLKPFVCERTKTSGCGTGYSTEGEKCYKYNMVAMTVSSARRHCESEDARLVHIASATEQTAVYQAALNHEIWIGLHLKELWKWRGHDAYRWHNGKTDHAPWVPGKPELGDLCAALLPNGTWSSTPDCDELKGVICDIPKVSALQWGTWNPSAVSPWDAESNAAVILGGTITQQCPIKRFAFNTGKRSDCLQSHRGFLYLGAVDTNVDGDACQRWDTLTTATAETVPEPKNMNTKTSLSDLQNYCAVSSDEDFGPWCETEDPILAAKTCKIPTCPFVRETTCRTTFFGREYEGTLSTANDGATCLRWDAIDAVADLRKYFPEKNLTLAENFCRNPTNDVHGPYCYTTSTLKATCNIPICEWRMQTTCRATHLGWDYMGQLGTTVSGVSCQSWNSYGYSGNAFPEKYKPGAYCRNPDRSSRGPWCYISNDAVREYCVVPLCDNVKRTTCRKSPSGWEYQGEHSKAHTGEDCMLWNATSMANFHFVEGTSSDAVNYCRNPTYVVTGPFCVVDVGGAQVQKHCDIPICDDVTRTTCRKTHIGWEYAGTQAATASGHPCQRWDSQTPNTHGFTPADVIPASWNPENYCRNPDYSKNGPWCYKAYEAGWEHCDIPLCDGEY